MRKIIFQEDFKTATKLVDEIVDNTEKNNIEQKIKSELQSTISELEPNEQRKYLSHISTLFLNVMVNELSWRSKKSEERTREARTTLLNWIEELR